MAQKKGQVTFFVVIGLILFVVISLTIYLFFSAQPKAEQVPFEYGDIESYVTGCLDEALESGVAYCAAGGCTEYEEDLGGQVVTSFFDCVGPKGEKIREQFPYYEIKVGNADINILKSTKEIKAVLSFPVYIKRANKEHKLDSFRAEYALQAGACIPCPTCDENCITHEHISVTVLDLTIEFEPGEFVGLSPGECLAC